MSSPFCLSPYADLSEAWRDLARAAADARAEQYESAALRLINRHIAMAFDAWCELVARNREVKRRAVYAMHEGRDLYCGFCEWRRFAREASLAAEREAVLNLIRPDLVEITESLSECQAGVRELKLSLAGSAERAKLERIQRVVRSWYMKHLSTAFDGWRALVSTARHEALSRR